MNDVRWMRGGRNGAFKFNKPPPPTSTILVLQFTITQIPKQKSSDKQETPGNTYCDVTQGRPGKEAMVLLMDAYFCMGAHKHTIQLL